MQNPDAQNKAQRAFSILNLYSEFSVTENMEARARENPWCGAMERQCDGPGR
jgi:hypothetical protein